MGAVSRQLEGIVALTVAEAREQVESLLARGGVYETAPRAQGLGEAETWLSPANRAFCERFQRFAVRGRAADLVLGAQTLAEGQRLGLLAFEGRVTQLADSDAVAAEGFGLPREPFASLWHLARYAADVMPVRDLAVQAVNVPEERDGERPLPLAGCSTGCAALPALLALCAWLSDADLVSARAWLAGTVLAGAAGWLMCLSLNARETLTHAAWRAVRDWPHEQARRAALSALVLPGRVHAEWAPCALDGDLPLPPALQELFAAYAVVRDADCTCDGWRLDRAELRRSDVLSGHVRLGRTGTASEIAACPDSEEIVVAHGQPADAVITERWPSAWHFLVGRLGEQPVPLAEAASESPEGPVPAPANDPRTSLDAPRDP